MADCSFCGSSFLFGGVTDQTGNYCKSSCQTSGHLLSLSAQIPQADIDSLVRQVHSGHCPMCGRPGPIDVHRVFWIISAVVFTYRHSMAEISCKRCGVIRQIGWSFFSGIFGWWGIPWGLIFTPVQIVRNMTELLGGPNPSRPSFWLERLVRVQAATRLAQFANGQPAPASRPPPLPSSRPPPLPQSRSGG